MRKFLTFLVGIICGALVGGAVALLFAPSSGDEIREEASKRWEEAVSEAKKAMDDTRSDLENQYQQMKES